MRSVEILKMRQLPELVFCSMVVGYFYFGYVDFVGIVPFSAVSLSCLFVLFYLNTCIRASKAPSIPHVTITIFVLLLALWVTIMEGWNLLSLLKHFGVPILLIFSVREVIKSARQMRFALSFIVFIVSVSCLVAVLQILDIDYFWELRMLVDSPSPLVLYQLENRTRAPGLAYYSVQLSYQIVSIFPFLLCLYYTTQQNSTRRKFFIVGAGICIMAGAIAIQSMSAFVAIIISLLVFLKATRKLSFKSIFIFSALFMLILYILSSYNQFDRRLTNFDSSSQARLPFTIIGVKIILNNPFGVESANLGELKEYYLADLSEMPGANFILHTSFHNSFINSGIAYGWVTFFGFILLYLYFVRLVVKAKKHSEPGSFEYYFFSSALAFLCSYLFQSCTHNAGIPGGDPFGWLSIGLILAFKHFKGNFHA